MDIATAERIVKDGTFATLYKAGFIGLKFLTYKEIYTWVMREVAAGQTKNAAVLLAVEKFQKEERTIWRAMNSFTN